MKKYIFLLIIISLVLSCRTSKKITESQTTANKTVEVQKSIDNTKAETTHADKTSNIESETVETTYYPPEAGNAAKQQKNDVGETVKGAVQSVKVTKTKTVDLDKTKTVATQTNQENTQTKTNDNSTAKTENTEIKKANPNIKWFVILGLIVISGGLYFFIENTPTGLAIKAFFKRLF